MCLVGVLELINTNVGPTNSHHSCDARLLLQKLPSEVKQTSEVEPVTGQESIAVAHKEMWEPIRRVNKRWRVSAPVIGLRKKAFNEAEEIFAIRWQWRFIIGQTSYNLVEYGDLVLVLRDQTKVGPQSQMTSVLTQYGGCKGMKCVQTSATCAFSEKRIYALAHFGGGLVCKGECEC